MFRAYSGADDVASTLAAIAVVAGGFVAGDVLGFVCPS